MAAVQEGKREARVDSRICGRQDRERKKKKTGLVDAMLLLLRR